jgi:hypothetical protein
MHPRVLLGVEAQVDARFGPFGDSANLDARKAHGLRRTYHRFENHFGLISVRLETLLVLVQDRCKVCAKCTIGSEIILDHHIVVLGDVAQLEARFGLFGDTASFDAR